MVDLASSIQDLGLAGIIVLLVVVVSVTAYRQGWVFGWLYRKSEARAELAETQAVRNAESLAKASEAAAEMARALTDLSKAYTELAKSHAELSKAYRNVTGDRRVRGTAPQTRSVDDPG